MRPLLRSAGLQGSRGEEYPTILKLKKQSVHPILIIYQKVKGRISTRTNSKKIDNNKECVSSGTRVGLTVSRNTIIVKRRCN